MSEGHKDVEYTCKTCKKLFNIEHFMKHSKILKNCTSCRRKYSKTCEFLNCETIPVYGVK